VSLATLLGAALVLAAGVGAGVTLVGLVGVLRKGL